MGAIDTATGLEANPELSTERVKGIFSKIAKRYRRFNAVSSFGMYKLWLNQMSKMANIEPNHHVLDVAGGTGDVSFKIARSKHPMRITCTDLVDEMLEVARRTEDATPCGTDIEFMVADAQDLPFEDDSFDAVTMAYGLRNMPERERALSEILRVLKPEGQLICLDFSTPQNPAWRGLYHFYLNHLIPFWGKVVTGETEGFKYLSRSIKAFPDQSGVADLMESAGFEKIEWKDCCFGIACVHVARKPQAESICKR